jgi:hypothetical protein
MQMPSKFKMILTAIVGLFVVYGILIWIRNSYQKTSLPPILPPIVIQKPLETSLEKAQRIYCENPLPNHPCSKAGIPE